MAAQQTNPIAQPCLGTPDPRGTQFDMYAFS